MGGISSKVINFSDFGIKDKVTFLNIYFSALDLCLTSGCKEQGFTPVPVIPALGKLRQDWGDLIQPRLQNETWSKNQPAPGSQVTQL